MTSYLGQWVSMGTQLDFWKTKLFRNNEDIGVFTNLKTRLHIMLGCYPFSLSPRNNAEATPEWSMLSSSCVNIRNLDVKHGWQLVQSHKGYENMRSVFKCCKCKPRNRADCSMTFANGKQNMSEGFPQKLKRAMLQRDHLFSVSWNISLIFLTTSKMEFLRLCFSWKQILLMINSWCLKTMDWGLTRQRKNL